MRVSRTTSLKYIIVTPVVTNNSQRMFNRDFRFKVFTMVKKMCSRRNLIVFLFIK